ncbi:MAG: hypothetical protein WDZ88_02685 [Candidatus Paceibacterota bacterium]
MIKTHVMQKGVAVLMAVIITSLLLMMAVAMSNIFLKQIKLSIGVRDSHVAFYMADQGYECAIYFDVRFNEFDPSTPGSITCAGVTITTGSQTEGTTGLANSQIGNVSESVFTLHYSEDADLVGPCALVYVNKAPGSGYITEIRSRGYNTCDSERSDRVERAIRARY